MNAESCMNNEAISLSWSLLGFIQHTKGKCPFQVNVLGDC